MYTGASNILHLAIREILYNYQGGNYLQHNRERVFIIREISKLVDDGFFFTDLSVESGELKAVDTIGNSSK